MGSYGSFEAFKKSAGSSPAGAGAGGGFEDWKKKKKGTAFEYVDPQEIATRKREERLAREAQENPPVAKPVDQIEHEEKKKSLLAHLDAVSTQTFYKGLENIGQGIAGLGRSMQRENPNDLIPEDSIAGKITRPIRKFIGKDVESFGTEMESMMKSEGERLTDKESIIPELQQPLIKDGKFDWDLAKNPKYAATQLVSGIYSMIPGLAAAVGTGGGAPAMMGTMTLMEKGNAFEDYRDTLAKNKGVKPEELSEEEIKQADELSTIYGALSGVLETIPLEGWLSKIGTRQTQRTLLKAALMEVPKDILIQVSQEGSTEGLQQFTQNLIAKQSGVDPERDLMEGVAESAYGGAVAGGAMGVAPALTAERGGVPNENVEMITQAQQRSGEEPEEKPAAQETPAVPQGGMALLENLDNGETELATETANSLSAEELKNTLDILAKAEEQASPEQKEIITNHRNFIQEFMDGRTNKVHEAVGNTLLKRNSGIDALGEKEREEALQTVKQMSEAEHEIAPSAKQALTTIEENNRRIDESLYSVKTEKEELLKKKKLATTPEAKEKVQAEIDNLDNQKFALKRAKNKMDVPVVKKKSRKEQDEEFRSLMTERDRADKEYKEKYKTYDPYEMSDNGDEALPVHKGDYIINRQGEIAVVTSGNLEYLENDSSLNDWNRGFLRAKLFNNKRADEDGTIEYANQIRFATREELKENGINPDLAREGKHLNPGEHLTKKEIENVINNRKQYEQSNQNSRGGNKPGELPGGVRVGAEEQKRTGKHDQENAGKGQQPGGDTTGKSRKRSPKRQQLIEIKPIASLIEERIAALKAELEGKGETDFISFEKGDKENEIARLEKELELLKNAKTTAEIDGREVKRGDFVQYGGRVMIFDSLLSNGQVLMSDPHNGLQYYLKEDIEDVNIPSRQYVESEYERVPEWKKFPDFEARLAKLPNEEPESEPYFPIFNEEEATDKKYTKSEIEELVNSKDEFTEAEKNILRQYEGSGGQKEGEGRGLLDEYYTPKVVIDKVWKLVKRNISGKINTVLEPSAGTGRFLEQAPKGAKLSALETNPISAKIAKILNPDAIVYNDPFESIFIDEKGNKKTFPSGMLDVVVGNPPYGIHRGKYKGLGEENKIGRYEEYFLKRSLDLTREGGIVAMVVPSGFLRGKEDYVKTEISKMAELVDAYRLPNGSFGTTDVGTDIVIFKKRPILDGKDSNDRLAIVSRTRTISNDIFFRDVMNQDKVLGTATTRKGRFGLENWTEGTLEEAMGKLKIDEEVAEAQAIEEFEDEDKEAVEMEQPLTPELKKQAIRKTRIAKVRKTKAEKNKKDVEVKGVLKRDPENQHIVLGVKKANVQTFSQGELSPEEQKFYDLTLEDGTISPMELTEEEKDKLNYSKGNYLTDFNYYQGDIYEKLEQLERDRDEISPALYEKQKKGLEAIKPQEMEIRQITILPIDKMAREIKLDSGDTLIDGFTKWLQELPHDALEGSSRWEIAGYLNGSPVRGGNKEQNAKEKTRRRQVANKLFKKYYIEELEAGDQQKITDKFNRTFNSYVKPDYTKYPLQVELFENFYNKPFTIRPIQMEGSAFLVNKGVGLLAYEVGVGKTLAGISAISEVMRKGWAQKPLIIVPKNLKSKWIRDLTESMPNVKINDLSNLGGNFKYKGKPQDLAIENGSISIITEDGFKRIGFKPETYGNLTHNLQDVLYDDSKKSKRGREIEKAKTEETIGMAMKKTDYPITFEDFGFDHITIDEAHRSKNIFQKAKAKSDKGQSANEYGAIHGAVSERGLKTYLATQYVLSQNGGRNVFLLTATPFNNSPIEIYSMLSLMAKSRLEELGIKNLNDFISLFCEIETKYAIKANGSVQLSDQVRKFSNLQQLQKLVREYIDFRTGGEAGIPRPEKTKLTPYLRMNDTQAKYIEQAQELFSSKFKEEGGTLLAISELQKITFSPYLSRYFTGNISSVSPKDIVENSPKIKYAVEAIKKAHAANPGVGQIIFSEKGVELFRPIREYFIKELKYKPGEVEIIDSSCSDAVKDDIQDRFQNGEVRVLLASGTVKEGVDLQKNSTDLYNLYLQWNPTDMIQAEGRTWRQGSFYDKVRIHYPLVQNSVDPFIFQKLEEKASRISNIFSYKGDNLDVSDIDFEGMKFELITDPVMRVDAKYEYDKAELESKVSVVEAEIAFLERHTQKIDEIKEDVENYTKYKEEAKKSDDPSDVAYYSEKLTKKKAELAEEEAKIEKKGINLAEVKEKINEKQGELQKVREERDALYEKFQEERKKAEEEKFKVISGTNNFDELLSHMGDKEFFTHEGEVHLGKIPIASFMPDYLAGEVQVSGYFKQNGTLVQSYQRRAPQPLTDEQIIEKNRGVEKMRSKLKKELERGNMTLKEFQMVDRFIKRFEEQLGDVALFIEESGDSQGVFEYTDKILGLFRENIMRRGQGFKKTFVHEAWHSLTRYLPVKYFNAIEKLYKQEKAEFMRQNPSFAMEWSRAEDEGEQAVMRLFSKNIKYYRYYDINEWFAETMTDKTLDEMEKEWNMTPDNPVIRIFSFFKGLIRAAVEAVQSVMGTSTSTKIFREFWEGKNKRMELRYGFMGSRSSKLIDSTPDAQKSTEKPLIKDGHISVLNLYKRVYSELYEGKAPAMNTLEDEKLTRGMTKRAFTLGKRYAAKVTKDNYKQVNREIRNYIVKNIPVKNRGELLRDVINAKNAQDVEKVIVKVDRMVEIAKGKEIAQEKKDLMKKIYQIFLERGMIDKSTRNTSNVRVNGAMLRQIVQHVSKDKRVKMRQLTMDELQQLKQIAETLKQDKDERIILISDMKRDKINDLMPEELQGKEFITMGDIEESLVNKDITGGWLGLLNKNLTRASRMVMIKNEITRKIYDKFTNADRHYAEQFDEFIDKFGELYKKASGKWTKFREPEMDAKIIEYLEGRATEETLTPDELKLANEMINFYAESIEVMKPNRLRKYYFTHTKQGFLEAVHSVGFGQAVKDFFNKEFMDDLYKDLPPELAANLEFIVANRVFNPYGLPRKGARFSHDLRKALQSYAHVYFMKKNFDRLYQQSNAVMQILPPNMQTFFKRYLQSAKGRPEARQFNPTIKKILEKAVSWEYIKLLAGNLVSGVFNVTVGLIDNYAAYGIFTRDSLIKGHVRYATPKGYKLIRKYRVANQNVTYEMTQLMHTVPEIANRILFFHLGIGEHYLRGTAFLSSLTKEEFRSGVVSDKRMSEIRHKIGEAQPLYGRFDSPVYGRHALGKTMYMFLTWLPTSIENKVNWTVGATRALKNEKGIKGKIIQNKDLGKIIRWSSAFILMSLMFGDRDKWKKEMEQYKNLFMIDYWVNLMNPTTKPVWADVINIGLMLKYLVKQEAYKRSGSDYEAGDMKWQVYLKRLVEPTAVKRLEQGDFFKGLMPEPPKSAEQKFREEQKKINEKYK